MEKKNTPFTISQQSSSLDETTSGKTLKNSSDPKVSVASEKIKPSRLKTRGSVKKATGDCESSSSSGTQFFRKEKHKETFERINTDEYFGQSESISGSSRTFHCVHGPEGKLYTEKGLLKRNLMKELDPIPFDPDWNDKCPPSYGWDIAQTLEFLVTDPVGVNHLARLEALLCDFVKISSKGYKVHVLDSICVVLDHLVESSQKMPKMKEHLVMLLSVMEKPILLNLVSDVVTCFDKISSYIGYMGYLLMRLEDDDLFTLVSNGIIWQLSAPDAARGRGAARRQVALAAAAPVLVHTTARMLAVTDTHRFTTFLEVALLLASDSADNCIELMKENIIENIFYRFNPYFPDANLPTYEETPADPQDHNLKLGDSSVNISTTLSLLLILLKSAKEYLDLNPNQLNLPCPDSYSQRCFIWAYRHECRAREHSHERNTMTVIVGALLHCFQDRLAVFSSLLMPDLMSLSVLTELPIRSDWIGTVKFSTSQIDVQFKSLLIEVCVNFIKVFPANKFLFRAPEGMLSRWFRGCICTVVINMPVWCGGLWPALLIHPQCASGQDRTLRMTDLLFPYYLLITSAIKRDTRAGRHRLELIHALQASVSQKTSNLYSCAGIPLNAADALTSQMVESRYWLLGLMYLIDPGLCYLRAHWSPALFAELRKTALKALVCVLPRMPPRLAVEYGLIRRIMWYIEWYSESPFELPILYWCLRLLQVIVENRNHCQKRSSLLDLFDTHGIIIIIHLCYTLLNKKQPPVEKAQAVMSLNLRLLTEALDVNRKLTCCVYPDIRWPSSINSLTRKMMDTVLYSLDKHHIISDRMLVSLMNFIWEAVIWNPVHRATFIANNGIYKLLDLITMARAPVQCIALALVCDAARAGNAVGQLVTWRADICASHAAPSIVKRGATIATLMASIFRDECRRTGVRLNEDGVIQNLDCPIMAESVRKAIHENYFLTDKSRRSPVCLSAGDLAGSRLSKVFALLHLLSDDLEYSVALADEAYNMYKNIKLAPEDESVLVLCSHYMTLKLCEVWMETKIQSPGLVPPDQDILEEFLNIGIGWAKEVKRQQEDVIQKEIAKQCEEESSLYAFLGRVRLHIALEALRQVRCMARSADRARMTTGLLHDAVLAHHRRAAYARKLQEPVLRTYGPMLDDQNITGQNVKVYSISKDRPKPREYPQPS